MSGENSLLGLQKSDSCVLHEREQSQEINSFDSTYKDTNTIHEDSTFMN